MSALVRHRVFSWCRAGFQQDGKLGALNIEHGSSVHASARLKSSKPNYDLQHPRAQPNGNNDGALLSTTVTWRMKRSGSLPSGVRFEPCPCMVTCAFRWLSVPYAFSHPFQPHLYILSISSYRRLGRLCCCAPGMGTNEYTVDSGCPPCGNMLVPAYPGAKPKTLPTGGGRGMVCAAMLGAAPPVVAGEWPYIGCW